MSDEIKQEASTSTDSTDVAAPATETPTAPAAAPAAAPAPERHHGREHREGSTSAAPAEGGSDYQAPRVPRFKKKGCRFCQNKSLVIDYKVVETLERFITDRGKILPRRITGTCAKHQRALSEAIKRARIVALLPFIVQ
ncbi:MAG: 30S ribosomal protein S18 [Spirochaetes bacterium]|nr:MAG: 30S ribosomal protein S18 [Spirochaetota bacterium]